MNQERITVQRPPFLAERDAEVDILKLLDRLEEQVEDAIHFWNKAMFVDQDEFFALTNKIRASLPDEVKRASRLANDSDRIVAAARDEANRILEQARAEAAAAIEEGRIQVSLLLDSSEIKRLATAQAKEIIQAAETTAREIRFGADDYSREVLANLENYTSRIIGTVQRGREKLDERLSRRSPKSGDLD
jgi:hypothetical protein